MPDLIKTEQRSGPEADRLALARMRGSLRKRQDHWNGDKLWKREIELFAGHHWKTPTGPAEQPSPDMPNDRITVNKIGSMANDLLPFLVNSDPWFRDGSDKRRDKLELERARLQVGMLNYFWREKRLTRELKKAALDFVTVGTMFLRTGYAFEIDESAKPDEDGFLDYDTAIRKDEPWMKRVSPFRILPDWSAPGADLESSRFVGEIIFATKQDVVANKNYTKSVRSAIASGKESPTTLQSWMTQFDLRSVRDVLENTDLSIEEATLQAQELLVLYRVFDKKFELVRIYTEGVEKPLYEDVWPYPWLDGFPFAMARFIPVADEFFGLGLPYALRDQQDERNRIRTFEYLTRRRYAARKIGVSAGTLSNIDIEQLDDPNAHAYVELNKIGDEAFTEIPAPDIPADTFKVDATIDRDMEEIAGHDQLFAGGQLPSRTSAAEIRARQGFIGAKIEGKVSELDDAVLEAGTQLLQHIQANFTVSRVVPVLGRTGVLWEKMDAETARTEVSLQLESTSKPRTDPEMDRQSAIQVYQLAIQHEQLQPGSVDLRELFAWVMEHMNTKDAYRFYGPLEPDEVVAAALAKENDTGGPGVGADVEQPNPNTPLGTQQLQAEGAGPESAALGGALGGGV